MLSWSRPDPLTRDLVHLINARRHDHGDTEAAIDTLQAFLEQGETNSTYRQTPTTQQSASRSMLPNFSHGSKRSNSLFPQDSSHR